MRAIGLFDLAKKEDRKKGATHMMGGEQGVEQGEDQRRARS